MILDQNVSRTYNARALPEAVPLETLLMREIVADPPAHTCFHLNLRGGTQEFQLLAIDPSTPRARGVPHNKPTTG
jgi:hypothetical protein